jgi:hypothetical protein
MVSWFGTQNQVGYGLSVAQQNQREDEDGVGHASRSSGLLRLDRVRLGFPSFASKLVKERWQVVHLALSWRSSGSEAKDGRFDGIGCDAVEVRPNYPSLDVIFLLAHKGILVFGFPRNRTPRIGGEASIQPSLSHPLGIVAF